MAHWTTGEIKTLKAAYTDGINGKKLAALLPRHSVKSIHARALLLGISRPHTDWLRVAHEHFASRESGLLA